MSRSRRAPKRIQRVAAVMLALLLLALHAPVVVGAAAYVVERDGKSAEIGTRLLARREMLDLADVARFFGLDFRRDKKRLELESERGVIGLQIGRAAVSVNNQPVLLAGEVDVEDGRVWVPVDFLTRAMPRYLDEDARHDARARTVRFDPKGGAVQCQRFEDRVRITVTTGRAIETPDVAAEGNRRSIVLRGISLPAATTGCDYDETLTDLQVAATEDATTLTLFTGPKFGGLEIQSVPGGGALILDVLDASAAASSPSAPVAAGAPPALPAGNDAFDTVVIDAGHGGEDRGAAGPGGLLEKDLVLSMAQKLSAALRIAGLRVVMTRNGDRAVALTDRTEIANRERADLFVSLHANASPAGVATGAETYFLHLDATDEAARSLAALENDATGLRSQGGGGGDLEMLLWDMAQQQYLEESSRLADGVQRELNAALGTRDRGVKQANFLVLRGATMPAILVEVGFLSNPSEEKRMRTDEFQSQTTDAIARAILAFRDARRASGGPP
jgi:N-acetylmuramoyl-L-alanine amidase